ncbi:hypothetical protein PDM28_00885 [Stenotrophomonas aracearum]|jgi:hypothetical protein|uniref:Uncharacterized protein n=1 Tax=Stenotrophomonas aracearum TaxID=3003272 RepID=A0ABY9YEN6_9GAMM|nr:hypothetical protein [Stenotrophomonas sp. A5588]WNH48920.1 hypothetical protein PDM28_00885 [Stenotrophomonas sp. A5588]
MKQEVRDLWYGVEHDLDEYRRVSGNIRRALMFCESRAAELIKEIGLSSYEGAGLKFDELRSLLENLSAAKYKFDFPLGDRLEGLVYHMDRDDEYSRRFWHGKFSEGLEWPVDAE